jgi:hypothetical protein
MRTMVLGKIVTPVALGLAAVVALGGCAASPSAYLDRDEPINRTTGAGQEYRGTVVRVDEPQHVVVLDNGQMYRVSGDRAVLVNGQPVVLNRVQPGTPVTVIGTPVVYQNGQYVAAPSSAVVTSPQGSVVTVPAGTTVAATPVRLVGRVSDVDRDGTVKIRLTDGNSFEFRAPAGSVWRRGDPVTIDMVAGAPAPSALPR